MPNTEFEVVEVVITAATLKFKSGTEYGVLNYSFQLRRSSMAYLIGSVLPLIIITVVGICGSNMSGLSYGRVYLGITAMLTTTSIYTALSNQFPNTSEWTFISQLYVFCFFFGLFVIVHAITISSLCFVWKEDKLSEGYLQAVFQRFDADNTGSLNVDEVRCALHDLGVNEEHIEKCILGLHFDKEGNLDLEQWLFLRERLTFNSKGAKALARHHNIFTGRQEGLSDTRLHNRVPVKIIVSQISEVLIDITKALARAITTSLQVSPCALNPKPS